MEKNESGLREVGQEELAEAFGGIGADSKRSVLVYMCSSCKIIKKVIGRQGRIAKSIRSVVKAASSKESKKVNEKP